MLGKYTPQKKIETDCQLFLTSYRRDNFNSALLGGLVDHGENHLLMCLGLGGVGSEGQLGLEHRLPLQACALSDEEVVEVAL